MLHTVNKSPFASSVLAHCLTTVREGDDIVLLNDGIYGGTAGTSWAREIEALSRDGVCRFHGLSVDAERRDLLARLLPCIEVIDFSRFVALAAQHEHTQSWY